MKSNLPLTRRDVVTLVIYVVLAYNVLNPLITLIARLVLARIPWLQSPPAGARFLESIVSFGTALVFSLAFMPFVSLIAAGATGRKASEQVTRKSFFPLIFTCAGLMLLLMSLPQFGLIIGYYVLAPNFYGSSTSTVRPFLLQSIASTIVSVSFGFAFAFFPTIFAGFRARVRDEETVI